MEREEDVVPDQGGQAQEMHEKDRGDPSGERGQDDIVLVPAPDHVLAPHASPHPPTPAHPARVDRMRKKTVKYWHNQIMK